MEYRIKVETLRDDSKVYTPEFMKKRWWHVNPNWQPFMDSFYGEAYVVKFVTMEEAQEFIEREATAKDRAYHERKMKEVCWTRFIEYPFDERPALTKRPLQPDA